MSASSSGGAGGGGEAKKTLITCGASLGLFICGAILGARRTRRRERSRSTLTVIHYPQAYEENNTTVLTSSSSSSSSSPSSSPSAPSSSTLATTTNTTTAITPKLNLTSSLLDCPVCLSDLIIPRIANCGHTICTPCLMILFEHDRRPQCPVCRRRIKIPLDKLPINFLAKTCVEDKITHRGPQALADYRDAENHVLACINNNNIIDGNTNNGNGNNNNGNGNNTIVQRLRPAWNWFKWSVIIVTEFGAFLVSLKELVDAGATPPRNRRYQRIV